MEKPLMYRDQRVAEADEKSKRRKYYWEQYGKPLWYLFLAICVIYTVMHVLHIGPSADFLENPYELTR